MAYCVETGHWFLLEPSEYGLVPSQPIRRRAPGHWEVVQEVGRDVPALAAGQWQGIDLPPLPVLASAPCPLPRVIHYVWIGEHGLPGELAHTLWQSVEHCTDYRVRLHAHTQTEEGWQRLMEQFPAASGVELVDLSGEAHFAAFNTGPLGRFYRYFISAAGRNYGAASDILRLHLLYQQGGIYLDVDDMVSGGITRHPCAGPDDLLLNRMVLVELYGFHGYANSNFACHAGNRVLAAILDEMARRLNAEVDLFDAPRPWRPAGREPTEEEHAGMLAYIQRIFRLTGPGLFNDVLRASRPDYYWIERDLVSAYQRLSVSPAEPCVLANDYFERMHAAKAFYLPFAEPSFDVSLGSAHSWNPVCGQ
ncbi:glycosyltransferase family 32 protein [Chromobacterium amazonense]|uniref:glycosyltransferase family 32 protein n=1 Tax=Chromobacterium amazonense TaxID=1382803 RepID=UPI003F79F2C7